MLFVKAITYHDHMFHVHPVPLSQKTFVGLENVLKTSSRHVLKTSSTRLQRNNFTPSKTSSKTKNCYAEDVLKTCLEDLLKILSRQTKYLRGISVYFSRDNKSKCVSNKSVFHKSISDNSNANPKCIN